MCNITESHLTEKENLRTDGLGIQTCQMDGQIERKEILLPILTDGWTDGLDTQT